MDSRVERRIVSVHCPAGIPFSTAIICGMVPTGMAARIAYISHKSPETGSLFSRQISTTGITINFNRQKIYVRKF